MIETRCDNCLFWRREPYSDTFHWGDCGFARPMPYSVEPLAKMVHVPNGQMSTHESFGCVAWKAKK